MPVALWLKQDYRAQQAWSLISCIGWGNLTQVSHLLREHFIFFSMLSSVKEVFQSSRYIEAPAWCLERDVKSPGIGEKKETMKSPFHEDFLLCFLILGGCLLNLGIQRFSKRHTRLFNCIALGSVSLASAWAPRRERPKVGGGRKRQAGI